ncbi:MAG: sensor histidine kinase [Flavobacteriales bacterium]|nr:sensor histidine kinase [Flavobacteriales bacterium]
MPATFPPLLLLIAVLFAGAPGKLMAQRTSKEELRARFQQMVHRAPDSALVVAEQHMLAARAEADRKGIARSYAMFGLVWRLKGHPDKALPFFHKALDGMMAIGDVFNTAMLNANICDVHLSQGHWESAAKHGRVSLRGFEASGQTIWAGAVMKDLAVALVALGMDDSARVLLARAEPAMEMAAVADHAGHVRALRVGLDAEALDSVARKDEERSMQLRTRLAMARSMHALGLHERAAKTLLQVLEDAAAGGFDEDRMMAHLDLASVFEVSGDPQQALDHLKLHLALKDSIASHRTAVAVAELQERYEGARKDAALQVQHAVNARQRMWLSGAASGMLLLVIVVGMLLFWRSRERSHLTAMAQQNNELDAALAEKELLLQEVHHRVKNNLQMVGSLLRMQGRSITDPLARQAVRDSQDRVRSMALIHQDLYGEGHTQGIDMGGYVERLANGLLRSHGFDDGRVSLHVDVPPLRLDVDTAVPIGLILNELIVNALKHAFPNGRQGTLRVSLHRQVDGLHLEVSDDGVGLTVQAVNDEGGGGFGLGMLRTFAEKLQAEHETIGEGGTTVRMRIKAYRMAG